MESDSLVESPADSRRFGLRVLRCRLEQPAADPARLRAEVAAKRADLVVLRVTSGDVSSPRELAGATGELVYADSLVYYSRSAAQLPACNPVDGLEIRRATPGDAACVERVAKRAFSGYRSHYAANPRLQQADGIAAGYAEWATDHLASSDPDKPAWVVVQAGAVIAFATIQLTRPSATAEVLLNAVEPEQQGRGVYTLLLSAIIRESGRLGLPTVRISTQLANLRVQRVWSRLGFIIESAYDTYHVNFPRPPEAGSIQP